MSCKLGAAAMACRTRGPHDYLSAYVVCKYSPGIPWIPPRRWSILGVQIGPVKIYSQICPKTGSAEQERRHAARMQQKS